VATLGDFTRAVEPYAMGISDTVMIDAISYSLRNFCRETRVLWDVLASEDLAMGQELVKITYEVDDLRSWDETNMVYTQQVSQEVLEVRGMYLDADKNVDTVVPKRLASASIDYLDSLGAWRSLGAAVPSVWVPKEANEFYIHPKPNNDKMQLLNIEIDYMPLSIKDVHQFIPDILYNKYFEAISLGARSMVLAMPKKAWSDANESMRQAAMYQEEISRYRVLRRVNFGRVGDQNALSPAMRNRYARRIDVQ